VVTEDDGPPQMRIVGLIGAPSFITREQFAARHGTRGEVTRDMRDYYRRAQSMRTTPAGDGTGDVDDDAASTATGTSTATTSD
jgi:hypothetical protein